MSELYKSKTFRIILSILIAVILWLYVDNLDDAPRTLRVSDIPVEFIGEDVLMERGLLVTSSTDVTVDLEVSGDRTVILNLEKGKKDIRLRVDLTVIRTTGEHTLEWEIIYPDSVNPSAVTQNYASSYYVSVSVVQLYSKSIPIQGERTGSPEDGYLVGEMTFDQQNITVSGEQLAVANLSHALVTVDLSDATESFTEVCAFQLIDFNGQVVENETFRTNVESVQVSVPILMLKKLPLEVDFKESSGSMIKDTARSILPSAITVSGDSRSISRLDKIVLTEVDLSELSGNTSFTVPIPIPAGSTNVSGETEATVTISFVGLATQKYSVTNISFINEPEDRTVELVSNEMEVTLRGPLEELEAISDFNIRIVGDLADISTESGNYAVPATVYVDGAENVGAIGKYQITVQITR